MFIRTKCISNLFREVDAVDYAASEGLAHFLSERSFVVPHEFSSFLVQWVVRIWLNKEEYESKNNGVYA